MHGFGEGHDAALEFPAEAYLGYGFFMLIRDAAQDGFLQDASAARGPHDSTRMPCSRQKATASVWWYLGLISSWFTMGMVSACSIRASKWRGRKLLTPMALAWPPCKGAPGFPGFPVQLFVVLLISGGDGPVDQVQVQIIRFEAVQGGVKSAQGAFITLVRVPDFAGDEDFLPRNGAFPDGAPHRFFIAVYAGCVNEAVACFQRVKNAPGSRRVVRGQVGSVTDAGNGEAVAQPLRISGGSDDFHTLHEAPSAGNGKENALS